MSLKIVKYPDVELYKPSLDVEHITPELHTLAKDMAKLMYESEGVGLAAPQVGKHIRLIVVDVSGPERKEALMIFFNPRLTPVLEAGFLEEEEGCLSVIDYRAKVKRYAKVLLEAMNIHGESVSLEAEGLLAICLQHEVDHLDGKLFIDRISYLKRKLYDSRLKKQHAKKSL